MNEIISNNSLSKSQEDFILSFNNFVSNDNKQAFILNGYAGTGKTFITSQIINYLYEQDWRIYFLTPTGRSAKVANDQLKNDGVKATTIHRGIYFSSNDIFFCGKDFCSFENFEGDGSGYFIDKQNPICPICKENSDKKVKLFKKRRFELKNVDIEKIEDGTRDISRFKKLIFVDESSMVSNQKNISEVSFGSGKILNDLIEFSNIQTNSNNKIVFIGDTAQLTPIDMSFSPALSPKYLEKNFDIISNISNLTEVFRQEKESGILDNATRFRNYISDKQFLDLSFKTENFEDLENIEDNVIERFSTLYNNQDLDSCVLITHSTKNTNFYNAEIRKKIFNIDEDIKLLNGERLICVENNYFNEIFNGEFITITSLGSFFERTRNIRPTEQEKREYIEQNGIDSKSADKIQEIPVKLTFQKATIQYFDNSGKINEKEIVLNLSILNSNDRALNRLTRRAMYVDLLIRLNKKSLKIDDFSDSEYSSLVVKYGYSIVCHKAQGGEWNNVMIDFSTHDTLNKNTEDYFRWCYTAITRARQKNYFINTPESVNKEEIDKIKELQRMLDSY